MVDRTTNGQLDAQQGWAAFLGIALGVIPLVQLAFGRGPGLWHLVIDAVSGPAAWALPLIALVVAIAVIARLEWLKLKA